MAYMGSIIDNDVETLWRMCLANCFQPRAISLISTFIDDVWI
jgi:hypothetical protein